jgi:hypothetical protein
MAAGDTRVGSTPNKAEPPFFSGHSLYKLTSVRDKKSRRIFEKQEKYRLRHPFFPQKPAHHEINTIVLRCR